MSLGRALATVTVFLAFMCIVTYLGTFKTAKVEVGTKHYAEQRFTSRVFPRWLKMPFNTFVNLGYVVVGAVWSAKTTLAVDSKMVTDVDGYLLYTFNTMSAVYGGIQAVRILTQTHNFGVLDQWATLPFFALVLVWGLHLKLGWSSLRALVLVLLSVGSYFLTLVTPIGFEICLGVHIVLATGGAFLAYSSYPAEFAMGYFVKALLSCLGFVCFKLLDFHLAEYHRIFRILSGHFISKVFDVFQIHYVNCFFFTLMQFQRKMVKKKAE